MTAAVPALLAVATSLALPVPAAAPTETEASPPPSPAPSTGATGPVFLRPLDPAPPPVRRFVFAFLPALTFGLSTSPSLDLPLFFGAALGRRPWALGYQLTGSSGLADRYIAGLLAHRHHLTAMHRFGADGRGHFTVGAGVALLSVRPLLEAEARIAARFGKRRRGVIGVVTRLGWNFGYGERAPLPQFGLVLGLTTL